MDINGSSLASNDLFLTFVKTNKNPVLSETCIDMLLFYRKTCPKHGAVWGRVTMFVSCTV